MPLSSTKSSVGSALVPRLEIFSSLEVQRFGGPPYPVSDFAIDSAAEEAVVGPDEPIVINSGMPQPRYLPGEGLKSHFHISKSSGGVKRGIELVLNGEACREPIFKRVGGGVIKQVWLVNNGMVF